MRKSEMKGMRIVVMIITMLSLAEADNNFPILQVESVRCDLRCAFKCAYLKCCVRKFRRCVDKCEANCHKMSNDMIYDCIIKRGLKKFGDHNRYLFSYNITIYFKIL